MTRRSANELWVCHLGVVPYADGIAMQEELRARRTAGELPDTLLLLEHQPTYTVGRRAAADELPFPHEYYAARGIEVHATDRGGRVTYHGPGQLVGYPVMGVTDVVEHLRVMERAIAAALAEIGIAARGRVEDGPDYTGVWVGRRKIASLGVHVSRGISTHGFAVNVDNDLAPFNWVVACGLPDVAMTSIAAEAPAAGERLACFRKRMAFRFCEVHARRQRLVPAQRLGLQSASGSGAGPSGPELINIKQAVPA